MAMTREQMEKEIRRLKAENAGTRRILREHGLLPKNGKRRMQTDSERLSNQERAIEALRRADVIRDLTPAEKKRAAEWDALPREEQTRVAEKLKSTPFTPLLSESIIEDRG